MMMMTHSIFGGEGSRETPQITLSGQSGAKTPSVPSFPLDKDAVSRLNGSRGPGRTYSIPGHIDDMVGERLSGWLLPREPFKLDIVYLTRDN